MAFSRTLPPPVFRACEKLISFCRGAKVVKDRRSRRVVGTEVPDKATAAPNYEQPDKVGIVFIPAQGIEDFPNLSLIHI